MKSPFTIAIVVMIGVLTFQKYEAQENSQVAPSIYYYSYSEHAFITEQADGSNRNVMVEFEFSGDDIVGPGWSVSGRWFAWTITGSAESATPAMIFDRNTGNSYNVLPFQGNVLSLTWSPIDDLLLIEYIEVEHGLSYLVIDAITGAIKLQFRPALSTVSNANAQLSQAHWTKTGNYLVFYTPLQNTGDRHLYAMRVFSKDGEEVIERHVVLDFASSSLPSECLPTWSKNDVVSYIDSSRENLIIEDIAQGELASFSVSGHYGYIFDWGQSGNNAFVYRVFPCEETLVTAELFSVSIETDSMEPLVNTVLIPAPYFDNTSLESDVSTSIWSPDNQYGVFASSNPIVYLINPTSALITEISLSNNQILRAIPQSFEWVSERQFIFIAIDDMNRAYLYSYDLVTEILDVLWVSATRANYYMLSDNAQYFLYSSAECSGFCVIDIHTSTRYSVSLESPPDFEGIFEFFELLPHSRYPWLFAASEPSGIYRTIYIASFDGTIVRELGLFNLSEAAFGWLPENSE